MRASEFLSEMIVGDEGWGVTPNNIDIDHFGIRVMMLPSTFLNLAAHLHINDESEKKIAAMVQRIRAGGVFGAPMLYIAVPPEWKNGELIGEPQVAMHEGRHRMMAQMAAEGDTPVETHIIFQSRGTEWRNRYGSNSDYRPELVDRVNTECKSESGRPVKGPLFQRKGK